ncbi:MAG: SPFH domain-containing protein, partial [Shinella sp.]
SKIVLMPMEASALVGSLGGIGAIAREVFGDGSAPAGTPARARQSTSAATTTASTPAFRNPVDPTSQGR